MCLRIGSKPIRRYSTLTVHTCCFSSSSDIRLCQLCNPLQTEDCCSGHSYSSINFMCSSHFVFFKPAPIAHTTPSHGSRSSVGEFVGDILPTVPLASGSSRTLIQLSWREALHLPSRFLEHASGLVGGFLVHATLLGRVDFALAEFLLRGVEA